jgi:phosphoribosyl-ATP pyrophosphohydrolase
VTLKIICASCCGLFVFAFTHEDDDKINMKIVEEALNLMLETKNLRKEDLNYKE